MTTLRGSSKSLERKGGEKMPIGSAKEMGAGPVGDGANQALQAIELFVLETLLTRPPLEFVRH